MSEPPPKSPLALSRECGDKHVERENVACKKLGCRSWFKLLRSVKVTVLEAWVRARARARARLFGLYKRLSEARARARGPKAT